MDEKIMPYNVVVGAFGIEYNAEIVDREARLKGLPTKISNYRGKYCVEAGSFSQKEQAEAMLLAVRKTGYVFAYIMQKN
ncbi:MAG: SPOR domain-containing protein [Butyrivibrio sp.]